MTPRKRPAPDLGPVVSVEVSPCRDNGTDTYVTTPALAQFWTAYERHASGPAMAADDFGTRTIALIRSRELAERHGVPLIYRDARMLHDITDPNGPGHSRPPVVGSFTVELGVCDPFVHALDGCGEADTAMCVDGFPTRKVATAFARLVLGLSVAEAQCLAVFHGYQPGDMTPGRSTSPVWAGLTVTDWRVGVYLPENPGERIDWLAGAHQGERVEE